MKAPDDKEPFLKVLKEFETTLNEHGYGFQYAVLNKVKELHNQERSAFSVQASEFPVAVGPDDKHNTKIDFVGLRLAKLPPGTDEQGAPIIFLLAECKRANPAYSDWCFIRAPFTRNTGLANSLVLEAGVINQYHPGLLTRAIQYPCQTTNFFHVGVAIKTDKKGNKHGDIGNDAIEGAASQSMRGLNGFVNFIKRKTSIIGHNQPYYLFPVIFTTAGLWTSDADLSKADLESGDIDPAVLGALRPCDWLFYEYNQSPTLKHSVPNVESQASVGECLQQDYVRTIAIVSWRNIEQFMIWLSHLTVPPLR
jgi:hypothetical protein